MKNYIGVDLGIKGAISLVSEDKKLLLCEPMPTIEVLRAKKIRNEYDIAEIYAIIKRIINEFQLEKAGMERLRAIPHQSSLVAFSMGGGTMLFKTIFNILKIPCVEIEARSWQKKVFGEWGIQYNGKTTKQASIQAAKQIFPGENFKRSARCRVDSSDMTDSSLIAYYLINL